MIFKSCYKYIKSRPFVPILQHHYRVKSVHNVYTFIFSINMKFRPTKVFCSCVSDTQNVICQNAKGVPHLLPLGVTCQNGQGVPHLLPPGCHLSEWPGCCSTCCPWVSLVRMARVFPTCCPLSVTCQNGQCLPHLLPSR